MAAVGNFVPEIVPGSAARSKTLVLQGQTPVKASVADTVAKVGVAGSNPVVRSITPGQGLEKVRALQISGHNSRMSGTNRGGTGWYRSA